MVDFSKSKTIVIKVGTSSLTHINGTLNLRRVDKLTRVLADLANSGKNVVLVTSGAIGVGLRKLGIEVRPSDMPTKQAAAAVGQCELMYLYDKMLSEYGRNAAQVLLTRDIIDNEARKNHVIDIFERLFELGAIPIVNENDAVSVEEIEFGDNDTLSAIVAVLAKADLLILLTDIDGLYNADPKKDNNAKIIHIVNEINDEIRSLAGGAGSKNGTGGMITKINAAEIANTNGIPMVIANGMNPEIIYDIIEGKNVGTLFSI